MQNTIAQLIPRFARLGFALTPVPNTVPQTWIARDLLTGEVEDFSHKGDDPCTVRAWLYGWHPVFAVDERIRVLSKQGKTIGETADLLAMGWDTVSHHRRRLGLPTNEPKGSRQAWREKRSRG